MDKALSCRFHCLSPGEGTGWRARAWGCWAQPGDEDRGAGTKHMRLCASLPKTGCGHWQFIKVFNADFDLILLSAVDTPMSLAINHLLGKIKSAGLSTTFPSYYFSCPDGSTQITSWLKSREGNWSRSFHFFQTGNDSTFVS